MPKVHGRRTPKAPARGETKVPLRGGARMLRRGKADVLPPSITPTPKVTLEELLHEPVKGPVRILFLDADGTLTDGVIAFDAQGDGRNFWVRDGLALQWARDLGVLPVVISGRASRAVEARMLELGVEHYVGVKDKVAVAEQVLEREQARWDQCVMVGDDLPDVPLLKRVGWPIAVADAVSEVRAIARTITGAPAGAGAVREVVEMVLRHNGVWDQILRRYEAL
ncbi:MAG TPA: HAD hydrolase family protein [Candidatus Limnocylindria bacterium]|nr:HAD hydrolase family protein [Candidatus Limnocylindria bacterium]